ncbi:MAG: OmpP1/FadL family transporter [Nitrospiraceae bacterium]
MPVISRIFSYSLAFCVLLLPDQSLASAFRILDQGASGVGQGNAVTAQADDPSAIYYNPAGMTQLSGVQIYTGGLFVGGSTKFTNAAGASTTGNFGGAVALPPPTNFYLTANLKDLGFQALGDTTLGLALLSPFGTKYKYPDSAPFATATTRMSLELTDIKPTIAYKLSDQLSFGLGADIYTFLPFWGEGQAEVQFLSSGGPGLPPPGTRMEINGKDTAAGFNVSMLYTPLRNVDGKPIANIGLIYRSQATLHLDGSLTANGAVVQNTTTTLVLPQILTGGVAIWPTRDREREWKLELDVDYTGWKSFRNLDVHQANGATIPFPQNFQSTFMVMVGTEYKWLRPTPLPDWEIAFRSGYLFAQTPAPDQSYNPTLPADADKHAVSLGAGFLCKDRGKFLGVLPCGRGETKRFLPKAIGLDLAYQAILYEKRTVSGAVNPVAIPGVIDGIYKTTFHIGSLNLRLIF